LAGGQGRDDDAAVTRPASAVRCSVWVSIFRLIPPIRVSSSEYRCGPSASPARTTTDQVPEISSSADRAGQSARKTS
jgi:hypothetical protein